MEILTQKWQSISMDFIVGLLKTIFHHDSIFMVIDRLIKVAHSIPSNTTSDVVVITHKFMKEICCLHEFP